MEDSRLWAAVGTGNTERAKEILADGANPNALSVERLTALHMAARKGSVAMVRRAQTTCRE